MAQAFTFQQPKSQKNILWIILGTSAVLFLGMVLIFAIFGNDSPLTPFVFFCWVGVIMVAIFRMVRGTLLTFKMTLEEDGFRVENQKTGKSLKHRWEDVSNHQLGDYQLKTVGKAYLWIWIKDNGPAYFLEDDGSDEERAALFNSFVKDWISQLPQST